MNKPSKETKSLPTVYHDLNCCKENESACLVEDVHHGFYIFRNPVECHILKEAIHKCWPSLDKFMDETEQTILAYHDEFFKSCPPKKQDKIITARYTWNKIFTTAIDRRPLEVPVSASGRKSTIKLCEYRKGTETDDSGLKTPQANECLKMFNECITTSGDTAMITEATLRKYIEDNAGRLHTRQDPWRIFQYYRPTLISLKLITRK